MRILATHLPPIGLELIPLNIREPLTAACRRHGELSRDFFPMSSGVNQRLAQYEVKMNFPPQRRRKTFNNLIRLMSLLPEVVLFA